MTLERGGAGGGDGGGDGTISSDTISGDTISGTIVSSPSLLFLAFAFLLRLFLRLFLRRAFPSPRLLLRVEFVVVAIASVRVRIASVRIVRVRVRVRSEGFLLLSRGDGGGGGGDPRLRRRRGRRRAATLRRRLRIGALTRPLRLGRRRRRLRFRLGRRASFFTRRSLRRGLRLRAFPQSLRLSLRRSARLRRRFGFKFGFARRRIRDGFARILTGCSRVNPARLGRRRRRGLGLFRLRRTTHHVRGHAAIATRRGCERGRAPRARTPASRRKIARVKRRRWFGLSLRVVRRVGSFSPFSVSFASRPRAVTPLMREHRAPGDAPNVHESRQRRQTLHGAEPVAQVGEHLAAPRAGDARADEPSPGRLVVAPAARRDFRQETFADALRDERGDGIVRRSSRLRRFPLASLLALRLPRRFSPLLFRASLFLLAFLPQLLLLRLGPLLLLLARLGEFLLPHALSRVRGLLLRGGRRRRAEHRRQRRVRHAAVGYEGAAPNHKPHLYVLIEREGDVRGEDDQPRRARPPLGFRRR